MNMNPLIIIPARGGSKGIPKKNIRDLGGSPLISHCINAAIQSRLASEVFVSTDSLEIKQVAERYGASVPFLRPNELALDTSPTLDAVRHAVEVLNERGLEFKDIILLQPTQPFITYTQIREAYAFYCSHGRRGVAGVSRVKEHPFLMRTITEDGTLSPILRNPTSSVRRQDMPDIFKINGSIYINSIEDIMNEDMSFNDNPLGFIMPRLNGFDIDEPMDLRIADFIISES